MVTAEQLKKLHIDPALEPILNGTFRVWGIETPMQQAAFIGQCGHESGNFRVLEENLNYSAERLMKIWPSASPRWSLPSPTTATPVK